MAERAVHGLERILGAAVGLGLAEADVGELALDQIDHAGIGVAAPNLRLSASAE